MMLFGKANWWFPKSLDRIAELSVDVDDLGTGRRRPAIGRSSVGRNRHFLGARCWATGRSTPHEQVAELGFGQRTMGQRHLGRTQAIDQEVQEALALMGSELGVNRPVASFRPDPIFIERTDIKMMAMSLKVTSLRKVPAAFVSAMSRFTAGVICSTMVRCDSASWGERETSALAWRHAHALAMNFEDALLRAGVGQDIVHQRGGVLVAHFDDGEHQTLLVRKSPIERSHPDAGPTGHQLHRCFEAAFGKDVLAADTIRSRFSSASRRSGRGAETTLGDMSRPEMRWRRWRSARPPSPPIGRWCRDRAPGGAGSST